MNSASASGNGLGFALGGSEGTTTSYEVTDSFDVAGLVIWDPTTSKWSNVSTADYGTVAAGSAVFVPSFGPNGLLFSIGGRITQGGVVNDIATTSVYIFEPDSQKWAAQSVSGTIPPAFQNACMVGAQGDNGTYEVKSLRLMDFLSC